MIRLYRIPYSTNVERVELALAHKGLEVESVWVDPDDRSVVQEVSRQIRVPVIEHDGRVVTDSMEIVLYLEERFPERPLYPADPQRGAELLVFVDWFNRVWKVPPNAIEAELERPEPDRKRVAALGAEMAGRLPLFEAMLTGRDYLIGPELSAADFCAFPFLKYTVVTIPDDDPYLFHEILRDYQPLDGGYPRLQAWIRRLDELPRV